MNEFLFFYCKKTEKNLCAIWWSVILIVKVTDANKKREKKKMSSSSMDFIFYFFFICMTLHLRVSDGTHLFLD